MEGGHLRVIIGPDTGRTLDLTRPVVVGRDPSADLTLADVQASRRHAQITPEGGGAVLEDCGSTNGTLIDDRLAVGPTRLRHGARIQIGTSVLEYTAPAGSVPVIETPFEQQVRSHGIPDVPAGLPAAEAPAAAGAGQYTAEHDGARQHAAPGAAPARAWNGIEVYGLIREFKGGFRAVNELYLQVHPGEIYGFLGPNGAGKSTSVHMLTTLLPPSGGVAHVAGYDVASHPAQVRAAIGVALQEASLDPLLNAYEHMELQCAMQGLPRREWKQRGDEMIERVTLTEAAGRRVGGYSGGMKRRLDLALALVHRPRIIFLDEPTTGLDPKTRGDLWDEVSRLAKQEGVTVFLTTQYLEEADVLADRVGIIDKGRLVAEGTPQELKDEIGKPTVVVTAHERADEPAIAGVLSRFGDPAESPKGVAVRLRGGSDLLPEIFRALDSARLAVANVHLHEPTLDDVFLAQTGRSIEEGAASVATGAGPPVYAAAAQAEAATY